MGTLLPPLDVTPPLCSCGCLQSVSWRPGKGWAHYLKGHQGRRKPGPRLGAVTPKETRQKQSLAAKRRYEGKRRRDLNPIGPGVYSTQEYKQSRATLVAGKPCLLCGTSENVHAHHRIPGDDSTLVPLCRRCHASFHHATEYTRRNQPPAGSVAPLCGCGCGRPVGWKRVRGWAKFLRGHCGAKIPAGSSSQEAPFCACGCGEPTKFRNGKGWNKYKRGHEQRVIGVFRFKNKTSDPL